MLKIALTGGIGSGKSMVASLFAQKHHIPVIDTDVLARDVVQRNSLALKKIAAYFGPSVITPHGDLDRRALREIVFKHPDKREWLEALLHPLIEEAVNEQLKSLQAPYCLIVIPLLVESGWHQRKSIADRVLVIDSDEADQIKRACARDGLSEAQIQQILASQASRAERLAIADDIIENISDLLFLEKQVNSRHHQYMNMTDHQTTDSTKNEHN